MKNYSGTAARNSFASSERRKLFQIILLYLVVVLFISCSGNQRQSEEQQFTISERTTAKQNGYVVESDRPRSKNLASATFRKACLHLYEKASLDEQHEFFSAVLDASDEYKLDEELILALIAVESGCRPKAKSPAGAMGLMQLMPHTAKVMEVKSPYSIRDNIFGGSRYLAMLLDKFNGDLRKTLAAYHLGPNEIEATNRVPNSPHVKRFINSVLNHYDALQTVSQARYAQQP